MVGANEAEPNERADPSPRRPRRRHAINLCCAQSVQVVVEEVAHNLEGLGFQVTVVCGAEARAALLGNPAPSDQPTIHVVCVQGSLQERVLKPLRQALATHGGPNHHLFVAVLDLGVPLAMVGPIRRFAEALERPPSRTSAAGVPVERRSWREHTQRVLAVNTRSRSSEMQVVERPGAKPAGSDEPDAVRRRPKGVTGRNPAARISGTSKYRAVTASHRAVAPSDSGVRKRRRARSRTAAAARSRETPSGRVLGLPEPDADRSVPPPPPAPGEMAKRRRASSGPIGISSPSATPPPPPPGKLSSPASPSESPAAHHKPWTEGRPPRIRDTAPPLPSPAPATSPIEPTSGTREANAPDRDRPVARPDDGFRFTPPGVRAASPRRAPSGPVTTVPAADVLSDVERTPVQGVLRQVPKAPAPRPHDEPPPAQDDRARADAPIERTPERTIIGPNPLARTEASTGEASGAKSAPPEVSTPTLEAFSQRPETALYTDEYADDAVLVRSPSPPEVSETDRTLRRSDGTFPRASELLSPARSPSSASSRDTDQVSTVRNLIELDPEDRDEDLRVTVRNPIELDPEDQGDAGEAGAQPPPKRTILYAEPSASAPGPARPGGGLDDRAKATASSTTTEGLYSPHRDATSDARSVERPPPFDPPPRTQRSGRGTLWLAALLLLGAGLWAAYRLGWFDGRQDQPSTSPTMAQRPTDDPRVPSVEATLAPVRSPPVSSGESGDIAPAVLTGGERDDQGTDSGAAPKLATSEPHPTTREPESTPSEPTPSESTPSEPTPPQRGELPSDEQLLAAAADKRQIVMLKTLFSSRRQGTTTTWTEASQRCSAFEVETVKRWRLPHRREMKLLNAVLPLQAGLYWTKTVPKDTPQEAYVLDTSGGGLSLSPKGESIGEVLCVRRRSKPGR